MAAHIRFISAGAGSGKTHHLTRILFEHLRDGRVRPEGVLATTFTRKAAAELRERVRAHLLAERDHGLATAIGQARIGTVNAVCGELLEHFALEAGLSPRQDVLEETQAEDFIAHAIDQVIDAAGIAGFLPIAERLGFGEKAAWRTDLKTLLDLVRSNDIDPAALPEHARRNADDLLGHFPAPAAVDLSVELARAIDAVLPDLARAAASSGRKNSAEYVELLRTVRRGLADAGPPWSQWVKLSKAAPEVGLKPLAAPVGAVAARFAEHAGLHRDIRAYLEQLFGLCAAALGVHAERKRELGVLDFADQEHLMLKLLDDPAVSAVLAEELDLLLVDEFQDTSPIQLALFLKLAELAGAVYWVGDIKQAIYGFRGSDTALMQAVLKTLVDAGQPPVILDTSRRSRPSLVALVNAAFTQGFRDELTPEQIVLKAHRDDGREGLKEPAMAHWWLAGKNQPERNAALGAGLIRLMESGYLVYDTALKQARPIRYGDIAVLTPCNDQVIDLAQCLRALGLPVATARPGLLATPEAVLTLACLRRLNDAEDTLATAEILSLADSLEPEVWVSERLRYLEAGGAPGLWRERDTDAAPAHPLLARLAGLRGQTGLLAPAEALRLVVSACDLPGIVLRWQQDPDRARTRLANLEALLALAERYEDDCRAAREAATLSGLILWLRALADQQRDAMAEPAIDAVRILTRHAAKGLEWPVVVLTGLEDRIRDRLWSLSVVATRELDIQRPLEGRFPRYWPWPFGQQEQVPLGDTLRQTATGQALRREAEAESRRLLYVCMTRARDLLVLARHDGKARTEWLDTLGVPWLTPAREATVLQPPDDAPLPLHSETLRPGPASPPPRNGPAGLYGFPTQLEPAARLPLYFNPSRAPAAPARLAETVRLGERIPINGRPAMEWLGRALHAALALAFADPERPVEAAMIEQILQRHGVAGQIQAAAVLARIADFRTWLARRWGDAVRINEQVKRHQPPLPSGEGWGEGISNEPLPAHSPIFHAEYPVQAVLPNGQVLLGRVDLLIERADGMVLIDHKANPLGAEHWDELTREHAGQLQAYAAAVAQASGKPVREVWLFLPVAGVALRVEFT